MTTQPYSNVDGIVTGLKQGVNQMVPILPMPREGAPPLVLAADDRAHMKVVLKKVRESDGKVTFEDAFDLSTDTDSIVVNFATLAIELYFAKANSLAFDRSPNMEPFQLFGTLYLEDANGNSKAAMDLYMPMEASF